MLLDSARDAHLLKHTSDGTYLSVSEGSIGSPDEYGASGNAPFELSPPQNGAYLQSATGQRPAIVPANILTFTIEEIGDLDTDEFESVWHALGILIRARRRRRADANVMEDSAELDSLSFPVNLP